MLNSGGRNEYLNTCAKNIRQYKAYIFLDIRLCILVDNYPCFGGTCVASIFKPGTEIQPKLLPFTSLPLHFIFGPYQTAQFPIIWVICSAIL
jgi:hypothetical protein